MKTLLLLTIIYPKIKMNFLKQFCLSNNLPIHIRENTDFSWQKPQQLPSIKANFEGCNLHHASAGEFDLVKQFK